MTKLCSKCEKEKDGSEFYLRNKEKGSLRSWCIECIRSLSATPEARAKLKIRNAASHATPDVKANAKIRYATPEFKIYVKTYEKNRLLTDPEFKLRKLLRSRVRRAIKGGSKAGSAVKDAGAPMDVVRKYIESLFYGEMSWDNWGKYWELDHIKSLACFNLTNREEFLKAVHYTNLQPLTIEDHKLKTNLRDWDIQALNSHPVNLCNSPEYVNLISK